MQTSARNPEDAVALARRCRVLQELGASLQARTDWNKAMPLLDATLKDAPDDATALRAGAVALRRGALGAGGFRLWPSP